MNLPERLPWLFVDVDATLIPPGGRISPANRAALLAYVAAGGHVALATGKHPYAIRRLTAGLELHGPHIAGNGTVVLADGHARLLARLGAAAGPAAARLRALGVPFVTFDLDNLYLESPAIQAAHIQVLVAHEEPEPMPQDPPDLDTVFKLLMFVAPDEAEREAQLRQEARTLGVDCVRTSNAFLELVPPGSSKGAALEAILREAGWAAADTVAIGDSENDLSLLRLAGRAIAVANATEAVRAAADAIIPACQDDGVAQYLRRLLRERHATG